MPLWMRLQQQKTSISNFFQAPVKVSPTNKQPAFYRPDALPVTQPTVLTAGKKNQQHL